MPSTFSLIASTTLSASQTTVGFTSLPSTYKDLCLIMTTRSDYAGSTNSRYRVYVNSTGSSTSYSYKELEANQATQTVNSNTAGGFFSGMRDYAPSSGSNQFDTNQIYFADFASSVNKTFMNTHAMAQNTNTNSYAHSSSCTWLDNNPITAIYCVMGNSANFVAGSAFYLYGIVTS